MVVLDKPEILTSFEHPFPNYPKLNIRPNLGSLSSTSGPVSRIEIH